MKADLAQYENNDNRYLYNGKELQKNTNWLDYGARMYNPALGRFHMIDPKSGNFAEQSPYIYAGNNPIKFIDINGKFSFDPRQLDYIKLNYPTAYAYIMETNKSSGSIMDLAKSEAFQNALIKNTGQSVFPDSWVGDNLTLTGEQIKGDFAGGKGPIINVTMNPGKKYNPLFLGDPQKTGGYNPFDNGKECKTFDINERSLINLENAIKNGDKREQQAMLLEFTTTTTHEYLESYSNDNLIRIKNEDGTIKEYGVSSAINELYGTSPSFSSHDLKSSFLVIDGITNTKSSLIPNLPESNLLMKKLKQISLLLFFCIWFDQLIYSTSLSEIDSCNIEFTESVFFEYCPYSFKLVVSDTSDITIEGVKNCSIKRGPACSYTAVFQGARGGMGQAIISVYRKEKDEKIILTNKKIVFKGLKKTANISNQFYSGNFILKNQLKNASICATIKNHEFGVYFEVKSFTMTIVKNNNLIDLQSIGEKFTEEQMKYIYEFDDGKPVIIRNIIVECFPGSIEKELIDPIVFFINTDL